MIERLEELDTEILLLINGFNSPFLDTIMWQISHQLIWIPLFIYILYFAYTKGNLKSLLFFMIGVGICFLLADRLSVIGFKNIFLRYRPTHNLNLKGTLHLHSFSDGSFYKGGQYGFVSSHASNFFALSTYLFFTFRNYSKWWGLLFLWASIIGYSRIYLGVHYPLDVLGGAILGIIIGYITFKIIDKFTPLKQMK